jgi:hypothetical protein
LLASLKRISSGSVAALAGEFSPDLVSEGARVEPPVSEPGDMGLARPLPLLVRNKTALFMASPTKVSAENFR